MEGATRRVVGLLAGVVIRGVAIAAAIVRLDPVDRSRPGCSRCCSSARSRSRAALLLVLAFVGRAVWRDATVVLPQNHFGLCSAKLSPDEAAAGTPERMTDWLYGLYQNLAGKPMDEPLTFGDLWRAPRLDEERGIALSLMSVNLSLGRPVRITLRRRPPRAGRGRGVLVRPRGL